MVAGLAGDKVRLGYGMVAARGRQVELCVGVWVRGVRADTRGEAASTLTLALALALAGAGVGAPLTWLSRSEERTKAIQLRKGSR